MSEVAFRYLVANNPDGRFLTGVPLGDLTEAKFDGYPGWIQRSIVACPFFEDVRANIPHLQDIEGVGPKTAAALEGAGIRTVTDLVTADPAVLDERLEGSATTERIEEWQEKAHKLLKGKEKQI